MMQDIKKHVLAEGVETKEQLATLTEMGCDYIQGFYFSEPLSETEFVRFISAD
jgi:EAL domain-containing protein (putative c-di-GMP-specific phosphodiesterase class I)